MSALFEAGGQATCVNPRRAREISRYATACGAHAELSFAYGAADDRNIRPRILS